MSANEHAGLKENESTWRRIPTPHDEDQAGRGLEQLERLTQDTSSAVNGLSSVWPATIRAPNTLHPESPHPSASEGKGKSSDWEAQEADHTFGDRATTGVDKSTRKSPNLFIDTQGAISESSAPSEGRARSPLGAGDGHSPSAKSAPTRLLPSSSPISPRTRQRGFSLRRSVFARSIHGQSANGSPSEVQVPATSTNPPRVTQVSGSSERSTKPDTTITVSPALPDQDITELRSRWPKASQGLPTLPEYEIWARSRAARASLRSRAQAAYERTRKSLLQIQDLQSSRDGRHITLDPTRKKTLVDERTGRQYLDNTISSSKYTLWNFLPRQLFAQFSKLANFYFLCVSILQMIPGLSTTGSYTTIVPLAFFVTISMAKEGYEDIRRYKLDKAENTKDASVLEICNSALEDGSSTTSGASASKHWATRKWKDVHVGEVVRLKRDESAPADLALLHVEGLNGIAYFETMALDGETNLKSKQASPSLAKACQSVDDVTGCRANLVVEDPNIDLYKFEGKVTLAGETLPLTNNEIVYRGSLLRNTHEVIGLVIYTGEECKIRMNATKNPRIKAPALQFAVNKVVVIIVAFVVALAIFNTVAYQIWQETTEEKAWYLINAGVAFFPILTSFIILFNTMVPLSLYVSLEIVKLFQTMLMNDIEMYDEYSNTPMEARTSTINEELGQVSHIFSDKTGTLTNNSMRFRKMSVAGTAWLHDPDVQENAVEDATRRIPYNPKRSKGKNPIRRKTSDSTMSHRQDLKSSFPKEENSAGSPCSPSGSTSSQGKVSAIPYGTYSELRTQELLRYIRHRPHTVFAKKVRFLLLSIALCHTCLPEEDGHGEIDYQAASPDEAALVRAAQELGYVVIDRQAATITIKIFPSGTSGEPLLETYHILDVVEFSSTRKRMSIIVRFPDNRVCVFCKGADSMIMRRLRLATLAEDQANKVEQRVIKRQSLEAQEAFRRNSEHRGRTSSITRLSFSMQRHSTGGVPRPSLVAKRLQPIRDELDDWLRDRETDVDLISRDSANAYCSPRLSHNFVARSLPISPEGRTSFQSADEDMEELVEEALLFDDAAVFERCFQHINDFATEGLRTLLYGYRFLTEEEYSSWRKVYLDASTSLVNRQEQVERAGELIEQDFELAGATAIEDKLQEGVPETIEKLRRAKIKLWMLTGDKRETAINIGHSCRLIKDYSSITVLDHETGDVNHRMAAATLETSRGAVAHSVVVIDGQTLSVLEADKTAKRLFIDLAIPVDSVICCRASPSQKAWLVSAIRRSVKNAITLAIGDGANDIAMIQEAHVGIGITGKEGLQAARTSDYSIAQFRFLLRLLLVHGRWNYIRTSKYVLSTFWKEMLFYLTQALFQRYAGYTGTSLYESWSLSMFNTLFTSLPVIFMGIFEKDLSPSTLLAVPELYGIGHRNGGFNLIIYAGWVFMASSEAMLIFFLMFSIYGRASINMSNDLYSMGALTFTACVVVIAAKVQFLELHNKSVTCVIAMILSIGGWWLFNLILSAVYAKNVIYDVRGGLLDRFGRNALWWLTLIVTIIAVWAFEITVRCLKDLWAQSDVEVFQELEKDPVIRQRFEEHARTCMPRRNRSSLSRRPSGWVEETRVMNRAYDLSAAAQEKREGEIEELLRRPRVMFAESGPDAATALRRRQQSETEGKSDGAGRVRRRQHSESEDKSEDFALTEMRKDGGAVLDDEEKGHVAVSSREPPTRARSFDVQEMLRGAFGSVRRSLDII